MRVRMFIMFNFIVHCSLFIVHACLCVIAPSQPNLLSDHARGTAPSLQGLFDNETTQSLTACIFGLSTLLSSYSIYNVSGRIGEDALQHLALFSEYGRVALKADEENGSKNSSGDDDSEGDEDDDSSRSGGKQQPCGACPFQTVDFLVRDWQNFSNDDVPVSDADFESMEKEMDDYLTSVIRERDASDLRETRQQIASCFEKVTAYLLTHPGLAVTKSKFDGSPSAVDQTFLALLNRYVKRVFSTELEPKRIRGRALTAVELGSYVKAYAAIFKGGSDFPQPTTLLAATASANNSNAKNLSLSKYKAEMDVAFGTSGIGVFVQSEEFESHHVACSSAALELFDHMANFGAAETIAECRGQVLEEIKSSRDVYASLNESRNPLAGFEKYVIPGAVALVSWVLRTITDLTCSGWSKTCKASSDFLSQITTLVALFFVVVCVMKGRLIAERFNQLRGMFQVVAPVAPKSKLA